MRLDDEQIGLIFKRADLTNSRIVRTKEVSNPARENVV